MNVLTHMNIVTRMTSGTYRLYQEIASQSSTLARELQPGLSALFSSTPSLMVALAYK